MLEHGEDLLGTDRALSGRELRILLGHQKRPTCHTGTKCPGLSWVGAGAVTGPTAWAATSYPPRMS
jgi:hypothetical protein